MKKLVTLLLLSQLFVNVIFGQNETVPMAVFGDVKVASDGILYSKGDVFVRANTGANGLNGIIDNVGSLIVKEDLVFYTNTERDGLLRNNTGSTVTVSSNKVAVRKLFPVSMNRYTTSFPFEVNVSEVTYADGTAATYNTDYAVYYYDAANRAKTGKAEGNWLRCGDASTFQKFLPGVSYRIQLRHKASGTTNELLFPASSSTQISELMAVKDKSINLTYYGQSSVEWDDIKSYGWSVIGGLNPTSFELKYANISYGTDVSLPGSIHYWDANRAGGGYFPLGESETVILSPYVEFFVQIDQNRTFTYKDGYLSIKDADPVGFRSSEFSTKDILEISLLYNDLSPERNYDKIEIVFDEAYSNDLVPMQDVLKLFNSDASAPELWSLIYPDNMGVHNISINRMKELEAGGNGEEIELGVRLRKSGGYTFTLSDIESDLMREVTLLDKKTGKSTNLMLEDYKFHVNAMEIVKEKGEDEDGNVIEIIKPVTDRFVLFANKAPTSIDKIEDNIYAYVDNDLLTVYNVPVGSNVQVIDLNGRIIVSKNSTDNKFSTMLNSKGVYVVKINGENTKVLKVLNK